MHIASLDASSPGSAAQFYPFCQVLSSTAPLSIQKWVNISSKRQRVSRASAYFQGFFAGSKCPTRWRVLTLCYSTVQLERRWLRHGRQQMKIYLHFWSLTVDFCEHIAIQSTDSLISLTDRARAMPYWKFRFQPVCLCLRKTLLV